MKSLFVVSNIFLLGILLWVVISNFEYASGEELLMFCLFTTPLFLALLYANNYFRNIFVKWLLLAGYSFATIAFSYLVLTEGGSGADYLLAILTLISLISNASYMFSSETSSSAKEQIYEIIAKEKQDGYKDEGLWIQAISKSGGDEKKVESIYIKLRASKLFEQSTLETRRN